MFIQTALKPVKKAIEKREHKKLDFERFQKAVDSSKAKKNKTDKYVLPACQPPLGCR